jgi:Na+-driven multidrug efflux pump
MSDGSNHDAFSSIDTERNEDTIPKVPTVNEIFDFALPAMGIYLCSPLLSMIDTSTVGLLSGTLNQAALNPAVTITDYSARALSFLYIGTTNMIASSRDTSKDENIKDTFIGSLRLSFIAGTGLAIWLLLTSKRLLTPLIGNEAVDVEIFNAAWRYIAIRSLGMPAAAMIGTSQAACLGLKDNRTPFFIIILAAILNLILDVALVGRKATWISGTAGAAFATTTAQYFALALFLKKFGRGNDSIEESPEKVTKSKRNCLSTDGLLRNRLSWKTFFSLPCRKTIDQFAPFVVPVTTTQIGRCSTYVAMSHVVSSTMSTASMAAQQIICSIFYALIPVGDSCSITAQSFLPSLVSLKPSNNRTRAIRKTIRNIFKVSGILGVFLTLVALSIPLACPYLTSDPKVIKTVNEVVPAMLFILSTHGIFCASEGTLLGYRDLKFLGRIYSLFFVVVPMLMLRLKRVARIGVTVNLISLWNIFLYYQAIRIIAFLTRGFFVRRKHEAEVTPT